MRFFILSLFFLALGIRQAPSYLVDLSKVTGIGNDIWTFLCDFPSLSSGSEELLVPGYYYSLEKGGLSHFWVKCIFSGRLHGYIKIASVEDLDDNLMVSEVPVSTQALDSEPARKRASRLGKRYSPVFSIRWRKPHRNRFGKHHSFVYLFNSLFDSYHYTHPIIPTPNSNSNSVNYTQPSSNQGHGVDKVNQVNTTQLGDSVEPSLHTTQHTQPSSHTNSNTVNSVDQVEKVNPVDMVDSVKLGDKGNTVDIDEMILDNVYLVLLSQAQWQVYLSSGPYDTVQASRNRRGYVYYSNVISKLRVPLSRVGGVVSFEFVSDQPDRYVLMLLNPDQRRMRLEGYVKFDNVSSVNLPVEMRHHVEILRFFWLVNLVVFLLSTLYLVRIRRSCSRANSLLSLNFLLYSAFLLADLAVVYLVRASGYSPRSLWALSHVLKRLHEVFVLTLMVLLSLGWKVLRERLTAVEAQLIASVAAVCILTGFVEVVVGGFDVSRYLVHAVACICILMAANFNIVIVNSRIADEPLSPQAGTAYATLRTLANFRLLFFVYMFKPALFSLLRFLCLQPALDQVVIWDQHLNLFLDLTFDLAVYSLLFLNFLPKTNKGLFHHIFHSNNNNLTD